MTSSLPFSCTIHWSVPTCKFFYKRFPFLVTTDEGYYKLTLTNGKLDTYTTYGVDY